MAGTAGSVIRRKTRKATRVDPSPEAAQGAERSWRMALARTARDQLRVPLDVVQTSMAERSLAELLDLAPERGFIAVLEGPAQALGVILLAPDVLAAMTEALTTGLVSAQPAPDRRPTRTDAAMLAVVIDAALAELDAGLAEPGLADWARGYRYAAFLEEIRPLGLLLEDAPLTVLSCEVRLSMGAKAGAILLALPAGLSRPLGAQAAADGAGPHDFAQGLAAQVMGAEGLLDGVLARVSMTLAQVMDLEAGQIVALGGATVQRITLAGLDGRQVWEGRLGQSRGLRAVRLTERIGAEAVSAPARSVPAAYDLVTAPPDYQATGTD
ncbi:MAG: FliM/FliN family flagellar motor switch protein [Paracoccaceae bacterium]